MFNPLILHRVAHWIHRRGIRKIPGLLQRINYGLTGCDLAPQVVCGRRVHFQHYGAGVILHQCVTIGDDVWISPHVVLGQNMRGGGIMGERLDRIIVHDGAMLGAGAKVIASGVLEIGKNASIGANAVVLRSVPAGAVAVGVPARIIPPKAPAVPVANPP